MKILSVSPRVVFPPERGSSVRTYNLLRHLSERHEVRQFSQARWKREHGLRGVRDVWITPSYHELRFSHPVAAAVTEISVRAWTSAPILSGAALRVTRPAALRRLLAWSDVVLVEFPWQLAHCRRLRPGSRLVLAAHNVEATKFRSYAQAAGEPASTRLWVRLVERAEARAARSADLVLAVSGPDRGELAARYGIDPTRIVEIPNGADTRTYAPVDEAARRAARHAVGLPERPTVVYAGADIPPNRAGLEWIRRVARRTDRFTFLVVGEVGRGLAVGENVVATGFVDDFPLHLRAADLALCPIEHGGGTKLKLLEGLAAGLPTVAFAEALLGLELRDGEHLVVADKTEQALLSSLDALADDRDLARRLGSAARAFVVEHHEWRQIARRLEEHLLALVHDHDRKPGSKP